MSALKISQLLETITIAPRLLEKISFPARCRLRSTCKKANELVEDYRFYLGNKRQNRGFLAIHVTMENAFIVSYCIENSEGNKILPNPVEQLSGICIDYISFDYEREFSPEKQAELVTIFDRWRPYFETMEIREGSGFFAKTITEILSNSSFDSLDIEDSTNSSEEIISLDSVMNANRLSWDTKIGGLPKERLLERLKKVKIVKFFSDFFSDEWKDYVINTVLPQLTQESNIFKEEERSPRISFYWNAPIDSESALKAMHLIHSRITRHNENDGDFDDYPDMDWPFKIFAQPLENTIFLLFDYLANDEQSWKIGFLKKDKNSLKKILEKETGNTISDSLLDYMFKRVAGEQ